MGGGTRKHPSLLLAASGTCGVVYQSTFCSPMAPMYELHHATTAAKCCEAVKKNSGVCSTTFEFDSGSKRCSCVKRGYACDADVDLEAPVVPTSRGVNVYRVFAHDAFYNEKSVKSQQSDNLDVRVNSHSTSRGFTFTYRYGNPGLGSVVYWEVVPANLLGMTATDVEMEENSAGEGCAGVLDELADE